MQQKRRSIFSFGFSFGLLAIVAVAWFQRQAIFDWWRLRNYQAPHSIVQLAENTTMNTSAQRMFYVYHPTLDSREEFAGHCPSQREKTIVLGCYVTRIGIYLFDVTDSRLAGVEEVTAAHEMLHAAYDRLNTKDKAYVNQMLEQAFAAVSDERIKSTIDSYRQSGADVNNELHSILGTEVRNLPAELEAYYKRYFNDRSKIVNYSEQYEKAFSDRKAAAESYLKQMTEIETRLTALRSEIDSLEAGLAAQRQTLEQERRTTRDPDSFNAKVNAYNNQVTSYQAKIQTYNNLVREHNDILNKYNALALEEAELIKAIDSRPATIEAQ